MDICGRIGRDILGFIVENIYVSDLFNFLGFVMVYDYDFLFSGFGEGIVNIWVGWKLYFIINYKRFFYYVLIFVLKVF